MRQAGQLSVAVAVGAVAVFSASLAQAAVTISSQPTQGMTCTSGVCAPTAKNAVLNVGDLETLLASGSVTVTTTGTGVQASDIDVKTALGWSSAGTLSLLANKSVAIDDPVSVGGLGGLTVTTGGKNGTFSFGKKGNVTFNNLSSVLSIDGAAYTLVGDLKTLASDIASHPSGLFALASSYDASLDGTYWSCPVPTVFTGIFTGLGNTISNFTTVGGTQIGGDTSVGLFAELGVGGTLEDIGIVNADIEAAQLYIVNGAIGTLIGVNSGTVLSSYATGKVAIAKESGGGGLVGLNAGTVVNSYAAADVIGNKRTDGGGLAGYNTGVIRDSHAGGNVKGDGDMGGLAGVNDGTVSETYATGTITANGSSGCAGGLVGFHENGMIENSYASGSVKSSGYAGGLVGRNFSPINFSYSTGSVGGREEELIGGLIGSDLSQTGSLNDTYWDTDTSGQNQGAGNIVNDPGITGLTTAQFQSGLPQGFDPKVWVEKPNINGGFPYLLANKPAK